MSIKITATMAADVVVLRMDNDCIPKIAMDSTWQKEVGMAQDNLVKMADWGFTRGTDQMESHRHSLMSHQGGGGSVDWR